VRPAPFGKWLPGCHATGGCPTAALEDVEAPDHLVTKIEETFLDAYRNGSFQYLLIAADRV
jgi:hypothetical protein